MPAREIDDRLRAWLRDHPRSSRTPKDEWELEALWSGVVEDREGVSVAKAYGLERISGPIADAAFFAVHAYTEDPSGWPTVRELARKARDALTSARKVAFFSNFPELADIEALSEELWNFVDKQMPETGVGAARPQIQQPRSGATKTLVTGEQKDRSNRTSSIREKMLSRERLYHLEWLRLAEANLPGDELKMALHKVASHLESAYHSIGRP